MTTPAEMREAAACFRAGAERAIRDAEHLEREAAKVELRGYAAPAVGDEPTQKRRCSSCGRWGQPTARYPLIECAYCFRPWSEESRLEPCCVLVVPREVAMRLVDGEQTDRNYELEERLETLIGDGDHVVVQGRCPWNGVHCRGGERLHALGAT